jgi:hypothetical protein
LEPGQDLSSLSDAELQQLQATLKQLQGDDTIDVMPEAT